MLSCEAISTYWCVRVCGSEEILVDVIAKWQWSLVDL